MTPLSGRVRMGATAGVFFMLFLVVLARAVYVTVILGPELKARAARQHVSRLPVPAERGAIVDRNGEPLALTVEAADVFLRPQEVTDAWGLQALARKLQVPLAEVVAKGASHAAFVWVERGLPIDRWREIAELDVAGVGRELSRRRNYPHGRLAAHLLGFTNVDGRGIEGIELRYNADLLSKGQPLRVERDAHGRPMLVDANTFGPTRRGARLQLTIDAVLQHIAERELAAAIEQHQAEAGVVVVLDPRSGEVLAMATAPTFDPNEPGKYPAATRRNRAVTDIFEPGSTLKAITAAAALEARIIQPDERIYCENGRYRVGRRVIRDHDPFEWLTFAEVIHQSSNIGMAKVAEILGTERLSATIAAFGFGKRTGIDLPGEVAGMVRSPARWGRIHLATTSFGQGIAVTPVQLARAFAAIANGGLLLKPYLVQRVVDEDGSVAREQHPEVVGRAISPETAHQVRKLLLGVVEEGTGVNAKIEGFAVAGKTGTAQKVDPKTGRYSTRMYISSFVGFVPEQDARLVILVQIDSPKGVAYGGVVAAPVFRRIAERGLERLALRPTRKPVPAPETAALAPRPVAWKLTEPADGMPSFIGSTMREALVDAHRAGWKVEVEGTGFVIAQDPAPGTARAQGRQLRLVFGTPTL